jgi:hypothetical protein
MAGEQIVAIVRDVTLNPSGDDIFVVLPAHAVYSPRSEAPLLGPGTYFHWSALSENRAAAEKLLEVLEAREDIEHAGTWRLGRNGN